MDDAERTLETLERLRPDMFYSPGNRCWHVRGENDAGGPIEVCGDTLPEAVAALTAEIAKQDAENAANGVE